MNGEMKRAQDGDSEFYSLIPWEKPSGLPFNSNWALKRGRSFFLCSFQTGQSWLGLFEQFFRFDKWNACRVQAAAICDSRLK
jgi:hypothetical protein